MDQWRIVDVIHHIMNDLVCLSRIIRDQTVCSYFKCRYLRRGVKRNRHKNTTIVRNLQIQRNRHTLVSITWLSEISLRRNTANDENNKDKKWMNRKLCRYSVTIFLEEIVQAFDLKSAWVFFRNISSDSLRGTGRYRDGGDCLVRLINMPIPIVNTRHNCLTVLNVFKKRKNVICKIYEYKDILVFKLNIFCNDVNTWKTRPIVEGCNFYLRDILGGRQGLDCFRIIFSVVIPLAIVT